MSRTLPFQPRALDTERFEFWRPYLGRQMAFPIFTGDKEYVARFNFDVLFNGYMPLNDPFYFMIHYGKNPIIAAVPYKALTLLLDAYAAPLEPEHFDEAFCINILEIILAKNINYLRDKLGVVITLSPFTGEEISPLKTQFLISPPGSALQFPLNLFADRGIMQEVMTVIGAHSPQTPLLRYTVGARAAAAVKFFSKQRILSLKEGEIIILFINRHPVNQPLVIIGQQLVFETVFQNGQLAVTSQAVSVYDHPEFQMSQGVPPSLPGQTPFAPQPAGQAPAFAPIPTGGGGQPAFAPQPQGQTPFTPMPPQQAQMQTPGTSYPQFGQAPSAAQAAVKDLRIPVIFELSYVEIPADTVNRLQVGQVLDLQKQLTESINIIVNNRVIARGEIVQVGQNYGVLIKEAL
jgi:flagellar motor switch/type III secretory pathway protein FliN